MHNRHNFDTLRYANRLKAVGVPEKQAELQAELQAETLDKIDAVINEKIATKRDIADLGSKTERDMKDLELRLTLKITGILGGMIISGFAVLGFLMKLH